MTAICAVEVLDRIDPTDNLRRDVLKALSVGTLSTLVEIRPAPAIIDDIAANEARPSWAFQLLT